MSTTTGLPPNVADYRDVLRAELMDLARRNATTCCRKSSRRCSRRPARHAARPRPAPGPSPRTRCPPRSRGSPPRAASPDRCQRRPRDHRRPGRRRGHRRAARDHGHRVLHGRPHRRAPPAVLDNVYAYDRAGRPLHDVRLYDSHGTPLDYGRNFANPDRREVFDSAGKEVFNAFPVRYFEPGTRKAANPDAGPRIAAPKLKTPRLDERR